MNKKNFLYLLLISAMVILIWSGINPKERLTWWLETLPVFIAVILCVATYKKFELTSLVYLLIWVECVILMVGGHYTYAEVPLFDWFKEAFNQSRNNYDKLGHLAQGFIPAIIVRELLLRTSPLKTGKWLFAIIVFGVLGISAMYELIEWAAAEIIGEDADSFLGSQGDVWDTQKDMFCALVGAIVALLSLSKIHDKQLKNLVNADGRNT